MSKLITIRKEDLHVKDGYLLDRDNNIVGLGYVTHDILSQFNHLATLMDKCAYIEAQPDYSPAPSLDGYEARKSHTWVAPDVESEMVLAMEKARTDAVDAALRDVAEAEKFDKLLKTQFSHLLDFIEAKEFSYTEDDAWVKGWDERILLIDGEDVLNMVTYIDAQMDRTNQGPSHNKIVCEL